jgi:hypothetical protein
MDVIPERLVDVEDIIFLRFMPFLGGCNIFIALNWLVEFFRKFGEVA